MAAARKCSPRAVGGVADAASALAIDANGNIVAGGYSATGSASAGTLSTDFLAPSLFLNWKTRCILRAKRGIVATSSSTSLPRLPAWCWTPTARSSPSGKTAASLATLNASELDLARRSVIPPRANFPTKTFNWDRPVDFQSGSRRRHGPIGDILSWSCARTEQPAVAHSTPMIPFDAASRSHGRVRWQLTQSDQGVLAKTTGGELLDAGEQLWR